MSKYDDIINIPRWNPKTHRRMSEYDRAAQFAPFAALTGYDAMVSEKARLTDTKEELDEEQTLALNDALSMIVERINEHPKVSVTWFKRDTRKKGGAYQEKEGTVREVDLTNRLVIFREGDRIPMDDIASMAILDN